MSGTTDCKDCEGSGQFITCGVLENCSTCKGRGYVFEDDGHDD